MSIKALSDYTQYAKYAKYLPEKGRREIWNEQIERVMDMHKKKFDYCFEEIKEEFDFAKDMIKRKRVLGSQRALQFGGKPIIDKNAKIYNCCAAYIDRQEFFKECAFLLLQGCGVGFSVQKHHVEKLPKLVKRTKGKRQFVIPDSVEGWSDAIGVLIQSYFDDKNPYYVYDLQCELDSFSGYEIEFDYSVIRPEGSPISWGGIAPGPDGLRNSINKIITLLDSIVESGQEKLKPINAYDVVMHASDAVLSGGIRRSATICLFSPDDEEMTNAKTGNWFIENPQRGRSNNSALLVRNQTTKEQFSKLMKSVKEFGEPGFVWSDSRETLFNPCITKDSIIMTDNGPKSVETLIGKEFVALVNGEKYNSTNKGFYYTGNKDVYKVITKEGYELKSTDNHKYLVKNKDKSIEWKELKNIVEGEKIVIHNHQNISWEGNGNFNKGWLLGSLFGDDTFSEEKNTAYLDYWGETRFINQERVISMLKEENLTTYGNIKGSKQISNVGKQLIGSVKLKELANEYGIINKKEITNNMIEESSSDFYCGFLQGWFDADGSVQGSKEKGVSIRLISVSLNELKIAQRMLLRLGIYSKIYMNRQKEGYRKLPDGNGGLKEYYCKSTHELVIAKRSLKIFRDRINFSEKDKSDKLESIINSYNKKISDNEYICTFSKLEYIGKENVYDCTINDVHAFDANGMYIHNCCEISFYNYDDEGNSGFGFCNLSEINGKKIKSEEDFYDSCKAAAILGTFQAAYNDFNYISPVTKNIVNRDSLLGVSITGMMDNPDIIFNEKVQKNGAKIILDINSKLSKKIGINECARSTCVKPAGSSSCVLGSASGIHAHHAKRYIRRVQANKNEFPVKHFKTINPLAVEESVWSVNKTDEVISFLCEVPDGAKTKNQMSAIDLLSHVKLTQQNWVEYGTRNDHPGNILAPWLRNNVSNTITVREEEWDDVEKYIFENRNYFAGISLLPQSGDLDYPQSPFSTVLTEKEIVQKYGEGSVLASGLVVDGLHAFNNNLWAACDCALGLGNKLQEIDEPVEPIMPEKNGYTYKEWTEKLKEYAEDLNHYHEIKEQYDELNCKKDWIRRFKQFADRYVQGDYKKCTHMLKHVSLWKTWLDLKRDYKDIDWSQVKEEEHRVDVSTIGAQACSGGSCDSGDLGDTIKNNGK